MEHSSQRSRARPNRRVTYVDRYAIIHGLEEGCTIQIVGKLLPAILFPPYAFQIERFGYIWQLSQIIDGDSLHNPSFVYKCFHHPICSARMICNTSLCYPSWAKIYFIGTHEHRPHAPTSSWEPIFVITREYFCKYLRSLRNFLANVYIRWAADFAQRMITSPEQPLHSHCSIPRSNFVSPHQGSYATPRSGHGRSLFLDGSPTQHNTTVDTSLTLRRPSTNLATVRGESNSHGLLQRQQHGPHGTHSNHGNDVAAYRRSRIQISILLQHIRPLVQFFNNHRQQLVQNQAFFSALFERLPSIFGSRRGNTGVQEGSNERSSSSSTAGEGGRDPEARNTEFHDGRAENRSAQQRVADGAEATVEGDE